ncbi:hypothetical protein AVEN_66927-1, partial [Araneus ventricosus]
DLFLHPFKTGSFGRKRHELDSPKGWSFTYQNLTLPKKRKVNCPDRLLLSLLWESLDLPDHAGRCERVNEPNIEMASGH